MIEKRLQTSGSPDANPIAASFGRTFRGTRQLNRRYGLALKVPQSPVEMLAQGSRVQGGA